MRGQIQLSFLLELVSCRKEIVVPVTVTMTPFVCLRFTEGILPSLHRQTDPDIGYI